jgi:hypothetical protein
MAMKRQLLMVLEPSKHKRPRNPYVKHFTIFGAHEINSAAIW